MRTVIPAAILALASLSSCISTNHRMLVERSFASQPTDARIDIYEFADQIDRPYVRIARVAVVGAPAASFERRRASARERARRIGAHALLVEQEREGGGRMLAEHSHSYIALRYTDAKTSE